MDSQNTVILRLMVGLWSSRPDYRLIYGLGQLNVPTTILTLVEVMKDKKPLCEIDESNIWFSMVGGAKVRKCAFNEHLIESLITGDWIYSRDRLMYPRTFKEIEGLL